jgi:hypothetical protein
MDLNGLSRSGEVVLLIVAALPFVIRVVAKNGALNLPEGSPRANKR